MEGTHVDSLPEEILERILTELPRQDLARAALVSKRWQRVSYDSSLYDSVKLTVMPKVTYESGTLGYVLARGTKRLTIVATGNWSMVNSAFQKPYFLDEMPLGTSYKLEQLTDKNLFEGVLEILHRCQRLTNVELVTHSVGAPLMGALAKNTNLIRLHLTSNNWAQSFDDILTLIRGCQRLRVLKWVRFGNNLTEQELFQLVAELPQTIEETNIFSNSENFTDDLVAALVGRLPNLTKLNLSNCSKLTGASISHLSHLRKLEKLHFPWDETNNIVGLQPLGQMASLKTLYLYSDTIPDEYINEVQEMLPNIRVRVRSPLMWS